LVPVLSRG